LVEDYELIHRLLRHGNATGRDWRTNVIGGAQATTDAPGTIPSFLRQRRRWFGGFLQTQFWYRDMIGQPRFGWLGLAMLPVKAIDTFQPIYGLLGVGLLLAYLTGGHLGVLAPVAGVIGAKIILDIGFHLWGVMLYRRWTGARRDTSLGMALLCSLVEPFSFQILRHLGASWGWVMFLTGGRGWGRDSRGGLLRVISAQR
jgi:cellulose synthase/poly-beta-1,6-N-acetylglucosamine synthase-like glycosyltransferase